MRVALVTGATSAIGRACATALARSGVAVALPLSDHAQHVAREIRASTGGHVKSLAGETLNEVVYAAWSWRGRLDILVNHASARVCRAVEHTETRHIDAMHAAHCRAALVATRHAVPLMLAQRRDGAEPPCHIVNVSPPLEGVPHLPGGVAYTVAKLGMTLAAVGAGEELRGRGVCVNALWPRTRIEGSHANDYTQCECGDGHDRESAAWRTPDVVGDALVALTRQHAVTAQALLDEQVLREYAGVVDFASYRAAPATAWVRARVQIS